MNIKSDVFDTPNPIKERCSFCDRHSADVEILIAGPNVYICDDCVRTCSDIIESYKKDATSNDGEKVT